MLKKVFRSAQSNVELETLTKALFVSQTAEKGGAELFLIDAVKAGGSDWNACFLGGLGPAVDELRATGFDPLVFSAESELLSVKRGASLLQLLSVSRALITAAFRLAAKAKHYDVLCANSQKAMFVCALASKLCGKPLVWCLHDIVTDESFSAVNRKAVVLFS